MKLQDLFENRHIDHSVKVPESASRLNYADAIVDGEFDCSNSDIKYLKGSPKWISGSFSCYGTKIRSLEGITEHIGDDLNCFFTPITSFQNIHKQVKYIGGQLYGPKSVKSHILGVMFIKGLKAIHIIDDNSDQKQVVSIINKHLPGGNIHDVQGELIQAGLKEYAKL